MSKRNNGEGSWGKKIINGYKYYTYRDSNGKTYYGKTQIGSLVQYRLRLLAA